MERVKRLNTLTLNYSGRVVNLGVESHDDLCDGLTYLLQSFADQGLELPKVQWIEG